MNARAVVISLQDATSDVARALMGELDAELAHRYPAAAIHGLHDGEAEDGHLVFLIARTGSDLAGCGALRRLDASTAEVKRMFVRREYRGQGIARGILTALEGAAREAGYRRLLLETGTRQPEALDLYRSSGYVEIDAYGEYVGNPFSVCMGKTL